MVVARFLLAVAMLSPVCAAHAQHPLIVERLRTWNEAAPRPDAQVLAAQVRIAAGRTYQSSETCEVSGLTIENVRPATADRFAVSGIVGGTTRNAWFVSTRIAGCDDAPVRFMVTQKADETFQTVRVNRGTSYAWESLISDTIPLAATAAFAALKRHGHDCTLEGKAALGVTRLVSQDADLGDDAYGVRYTGRWAEIWPMTLCGKTAEVRVIFNADGDGGAYTDLPGDEVRVLP